MSTQRPHQAIAAAQTRRTIRRLVGRLTLLAVAMFGFGFAMVPLYDVLCDVTGLGGRGVQIAENGIGTATRASEREVRIRFLATTNSALPWVFQPVDKTATVKLGALSEARFVAMNLTEAPIVGQATYNVAPPEASLYFVKTECFCFTQQLLNAQETREMPVYYFVQPDLPEHIREITLSYTFYRNDNPDAVAQALAFAVNQE